MVFKKLPGYKTTTFVTMELNYDSVVPSDRRFLTCPKADLDVLTLLGIDHKWQNFIRVLDKKGDLVLLHYVNTYDKNNKVNEEYLKEIGSVRGVIIDTETNKIICKSYPYTQEIICDEETTELSQEIDYANSTFYTACEGTILRLYNYKSTWFLSTHRKIDAYNSYWNGPSFGSIFDELKADNFTFDQLDPDWCYVFLMSHNSNRLVYNIPTPQLMLITIYDTSNGVFKSPNEINNPTLQGCNYPHQLNITNFEELKRESLAMKASDDYTLAGIIVIPNGDNPTPIKIINKKYEYYKYIRGNQPNIRARYVYIRGTAEGPVFRQLYFEPEHQIIFNNVENEINMLVIKLHKMYMNRYVGKDFSQLDKEEFIVLKTCHEWHCADHQNNIVRPEKIKEVLDATKPNYLLKMLNRQKKRN